MKNETLSQSYKELFAASIIVAHKARAQEGMVAWWSRGPDTDMYRLLREHSGIDKGSGFTDFSPSSLAPYFSAFIEEAIKDSMLSQLYSRKDLGPILIYQLAHHIRRVMPINIDDSYFQEIYPHLYGEFESLLYEDDWVTATIYPLVNFYSEMGWQERQKHKALGLDEKNVIFPGSTFPIDDLFEIKQIDFNTMPLLDNPGEMSLFRTSSTYKDFTGDYYALEAQKSIKKSAYEQPNLTSYLIGRPILFFENDVNLKRRVIVELPEYLLLALRLFKPGDIGIAPYRYISDYPNPLYVPDLYQERYFELAQVEAYESAPYILDLTEIDTLKKLYQGITNLLSSKPSDLEHIEIAQRYFQYSYSHKLTDEDRLQDRVVDLVFALEALLLKQGENSDRLKKLAAILIDDSQKNTKHVLTEAYTKVRNPVAHGRTSETKLDINFVKSLEDYVRQAIRRAIGLAINGVRSKDALQSKIDEAEILNRATKSENGAKKLRKDADDPFS